MSLYDLLQRGLFFREAFCYVIDPTSGYHQVTPVDFSLPPAKYVKKVMKAKIINRSEIGRK